MSLPKEYRWCMIASASALSLMLLVGIAWAAFVIHLTGRRLVSDPWSMPVLFGGLIAVVVTGLWLERFVNGIVFTRLLMRRMVTIHSEDLGE